MKKICCIIVSLACSAAFQLSADATVLSFTPSSYIDRCLAESSEIAAQIDVVASAEIALDELRISDSSEFDLAGAALDMQVERAKLSELRAATVASALGDFASLLQADRDRVHAATALSISIEKEAAAKNQAAEGVKNELDYFGEYLAFRNTEIAKMGADFAYDNALRRFSRRVSDSETAEIQLIDAEIGLPESFPYSAIELFEQAKLASSAYLRAAGNADIQIRRYAVYSELETTARALRNMKMAEQTAIRALTSQEHALLDGAWSMMQQLRILETRVAVGLEQLRVAELRWKEKRRGFSFGVVTERQLREHELAREREIDLQRRRGYDLLIHYLRAIGFAGEDAHASGTLLLR